MAKQILIDSWFGMVRTAIAENNTLVDYYEESPEQGRNKGNIYRGVVKRVDAPIQAAFVKFAGGRDGFLPLRDASAGKPPKPGDTVLVQVVKDEVGDKGAALTSKLSLSGRYLVFIPERDGEGGISSKISDEERATLKKVMSELQIPDGASIILRTAASDKSVAELQADLDRLAETHRDILDKFAKGKEPGLLFREAPPALRYLREYYTEEVERIWVNQEEVQDQCRQFFYLYEPKSAAKVTLSQDGPLLFQRLGLEAEVEKLTARRVPLPSGANIVIDQAEALVAIDVNSAKAGGRAEEPKGKRKGGKAGKGGGLEETVFSVNKEAAAEIARQLRLRDLGGIIIVDFIDMEEERHRRQIEEAMRKGLSEDKAKVKVYDISPLGIMQISRQRLRKAGHQFSRQACEDCQGRGWHPSSSAAALSVLRRLEERLHGRKAGQTLAASAPYPVANKLVNEFREHIVAMERRYGCTVKVNALPQASGEASIAASGGGEAMARGPERSAAAPGAERKARGAERQGRDQERKIRDSGRAVQESARTRYEHGRHVYEQEPSGRETDRHVHEPEGGDREHERHVPESDRSEHEPDRHTHRTEWVEQTVNADARNEPGSGHGSVEDGAKAGSIEVDGNGAGARRERDQADIQSRRNDRGRSRRGGRRAPGGNGAGGARAGSESGRPGRQAGPESATPGGRQPGPIMGDGPDGAFREYRNASVPGPDAISGLPFAEPAAHASGMRGTGASESAEVRNESLGFSEEHGPDTGASAGAESISVADASDAQANPAMANESRGGRRGRRGGRGRGRGRGRGGQEGAGPAGQTGSAEVESRKVAAPVRAQAADRAQPSPRGQAPGRAKASPRTQAPARAQAADRGQAAPRVQTRGTPDRAGRDKGGSVPRRKGGRRRGKSGSADA